MKDSNYSHQVILNKIIEYMNKLEINDLPKTSPRNIDGCWGRICKMVFGEYSFGKAMLIKNAYERKLSKMIDEELNKTNDALNSDSTIESDSEEDDDILSFSEQGSYGHKKYILN